MIENWVIILLILFVPVSYYVQLWFGNWLYKNHNKSFLRKIWWSKYDITRNKKK